MPVVGIEMMLFEAKSDATLRKYRRHHRVMDMPLLAGYLKRSLRFRRIAMTKRLDYNQIPPAGVKALGGVYGYIMQSGLPAELVELVYLRISQINNCAYCLDMHMRDLIKKGMKIEKLALAQAWREAGPLFSERERAALAWVETVTRVAETGVPDEAFAAVRQAFEERELVDLTIAIGLMNAHNRMSISFRSTPQAALHTADERKVA
jgi:AhpD family alkylhydroperoxidase